MTIQAGEVRRLREMTGVGMMDCKKALVEAAGDFDKAIEILRKKGQKVSSARSGRDTKEGLVVARVAADKRRGMLLSVTCETDFVARNAAFGALADKIATHVFAAESPSREDIGKLSFDRATVDEHLTDLMGKISEKVSISHYERLAGEHVVSYIHAGEKLGVLVWLEGGTAEQLQSAGHDVALQIAAMNPIAVDKASISQEVISRELEIGKALAKKEGKPEAVLEKIAQGRLQKFFKEHCLLQQSYVKDAKCSVGEHLQQVNKDIRVRAFRRVDIA